MKSVGLRELKNRLSEYVREVRSGEVVLVTDRGEVVAELLPPGRGQVAGDGEMQWAFATLARKGELSLGVPNEAELYPSLPRLLKRHHAAELLNEERGSQ